MQLDLRRPVLVLTGTWNPAIFQPGWMAKNLFEIPEGKSVQASEIIHVQSSRRVTYVGDIGIAATASRIEVYCNSLQKDCLAKAESMLRNTIRTLPHTPIGALGVNFQFTENDIEGDVLDRLKTHEATYENFEILEEEFKSVFDFTSSFVLNFRRGYNTESVYFDFNFHHEASDFEKLLSTLDNSIENNLEGAKQVLDQLYNLENFDVVSHDLDATGEGQNVEAKQG